jgi:hypothetical protein
MLALQLLHLGLVIQAREVMSHAYERALELAQPMARMVALWDDALLELRLGNAERVGALADEMRELVEQFSLAQGRTASRWFRGWAPHQRARGSLDPEACIERASWNARSTSETLGYAAEALCWRASGRSRNPFREAFQYAEQHDERVYLPQLHLIDAAISGARRVRRRPRHDSTRRRRSTGAGGSLARTPRPSRTLRSRRLDIRGYPTPGRSRG